MQKKSVPADRESIRCEDIRPCEFVSRPDSIDGKLRQRLILRPVLTFGSIEDDRTLFFRVGFNGYFWVQPSGTESAALDSLLRSVQVEWETIRCVGPFGHLSIHEQADTRPVQETPTLPATNELRLRLTGDHFVARLPQPPCKKPIVVTREWPPPKRVVTGFAEVSLSLLETASGSNRFRPCFQLHKLFWRFQDGDRFSTRADRRCGIALWGEDSDDEGGSP